MTLLSTAILKKNVKFVIKSSLYSNESISVKDAFAQYAQNVANIKLWFLKPVLPKDHIEDVNFVLKKSGI
jgi:hypothetical protein